MNFKLTLVSFARETLLERSFRVMPAKNSPALLVLKKRTIQKRSLFLKPWKLKVVQSKGKWDDHAKILLPVKLTKLL